MITGKSFAEKLLLAVGEVLRSLGESVRIVVAGGTAMNLHGYVERPTRDVDILARAEGSALVLVTPDPLPESLRRAIALVARDFDQPADWMNTAMAAQLSTGIPPGLEHRLRARAEIRYTNTGLA